MVDFLRSLGECADNGDDVSFERLASADTAFAIRSREDDGSSREEVTKHSRENLAMLCANADFNRSGKINPKTVPLSFYYDTRNYGPTLKMFANFVDKSGVSLVHAYFDETTIQHGIQ